MLTEIAEHNALHKSAVEQAGFAVLKAPDFVDPGETAFHQQSRRGVKLRSDRTSSGSPTSSGDAYRRYFAGNPPPRHADSRATGRIAPVLRFSSRSCCCRRSFSG